MTITVWQNVDFEGPAAIYDYAKKNGHELNIKHTYLEENLNIDDALIVLGGPMSAYDDVEFLKPVKSKLKSAIASGKKVYGICLGAQLIAEALGAKVYSSGTREIGWRDVSIENETITKNLAPKEMVFHWHGDTFDLPNGATRIASNDAFLNQAFAYNNSKVIATQFHFEANMVSLQRLLEADNGYLNFDSAYINRDILDLTHIGASNKALFSLLDNWLKI